MSVEEFNSVSHFLYDYVEKWANEKPEDIAMIDADDGRFFTWSAFREAVNMIALQLLEDGWQKGDIIVSMLPLLPEHIFFEYACFRIGVIFCPIDVRLKGDEVVRSVGLLKKARRVGFIHPDNTDGEDKWGKKKYYEFKDYARMVRKAHPWVKDFIQFGPQEDADEGTVGVLVFVRDMKEKWLKYKKDPQLFAQKMQKIIDASARVKEDDPILIIYTTGTTGFPKPAMLTNMGIVCQNLCLVKAFQVTAQDRMLVNLPPSHVGCQTEQLMSTFFAGGIAVILHGFRADKSMKAIQEYKVTFFGQIPSLFVMEWTLPDYKSYDISSLRFAIYGGQAVSRRFLERLKTMAPYFGSGLGLTELSGFCSYTPYRKDVTVEEILAGLGYDFPITPLSIREPMKPDGSAGAEMPDGQTGEVCYSGPQVLKGYYDNEEATRKTISIDGFCYTGDLGFKDKNGLHLVGRGKFVIKPKGYQVFPPQIEEFIQKLPEVQLAAVVGHRHEEHSEGVIAFVEYRKGKSISVEKIHEHCKGLAAYMRPALIIPLDEIPLNRVDKTDYQELLQMVGKYVEEERAKGGWDAKALARMAKADAIQPDNASS
jgi:acyl-CoA synthetase (AMP-forming)/AMP-acid ligase II